MTDDAAIEATGIEKSYGGTTALRDVSLSIPTGEVFALVGPNGAGKTTLVRCLTGTTSSDVGDARLLGTAPEAAVSERIGLLPQDFDPPERLTARELVAYYAGLYDDSRDADDVLDAVGVEDAAGTRYGNLSGGQKRRVLVGTALVNDPDVLFLDEPTTGIDPAGRRAVWDLIEGLTDAGTTVFLTTHDMNEVERLADRVGVLRDGELVARDSPASLIAEHGGGTHLLVETTDGDGSDAVAEDGDELPSVSLPNHSVERTDRGLLIEDVSPDEIGEIVDVFDNSGIAYDALTWREPDLETVYLSLTGEAPRESGVGVTATGGKT